MEKDELVYASFKAVPLLNTTIKTFVLTLVIFFAALVRPAYAVAESSFEREGKLKAACLFYIIKFIDFPENSFKDNKINICVMGEDTLNPFVAGIFKGKEIKGKQIDIQEADSHSMSQLEHCSLVYFGDSPGSKQNEVLSHLKGKPVLTVSGARDITKENGIIFITKENNKLKIKINSATADKSNLKISSELLDISEVTK